MRKVYLLLIAITFTVSGSFAQLTGTKNIPGDYADLVAAIADLNTQGVGAGGVVLNLVAGNPQTAPAGGYVIGGAGSVLLSTSSAANPVTITGNSNSITASGAQVAGTLTDAVFKLIGADYVTIQGFTIQENAANTTTVIATNNMTEWGVALLYVTTTDGAQNNTIQNNTISLNRIYSNTFGIYSNTRHTAVLATTQADATTAGGSNSGNKVYNNIINNVDKGIIFVGATTAAAMDSGNDIGGTSAGTGNTITNWGGLVSGTMSGYISVLINSVCIQMNCQVNDNVSYNTVTSATNITTLTTTSIIGIVKSQSSQPTGLTFTSNYNNNTVTITNAATTAQMTGMGMQGLTTLATATYNCNNNNIINCANTGAGVLASTMIGMLHSSAPGTFNINGNTVRGFTTTTTTSGGFIGIQQQTNGVVNVLNINNNKIGDVTAGAVTFSNTTTTAGVTGIAVTSTGASSTCALSMTGNDIRGIVYTTSGTGAHTYLTNAATTLSQNISNNTFTNLNVNTTGSVTFISNSVAVPSTGTQTINNNSIVTAFNKGGAGGTITLATSSSSSVSGATINHTNNNFSNITVTGATTIAGWVSTDGGTANKNYTGNTFSNWTGGSSSITGMSINFGGGAGGNGNLLSGNTITNFTGSGAITGISIGSSGTTATVSGNTISGFTSTGAVVIKGITSSAPTSGFILKNKICNLEANNASGSVFGIEITAGTLHTVSNNIIGDLRTPAANAANALIGLNFTGGTTVNAYNNTVRIAGTSSGALFGSSAVSVSTTPTISLRNNILVNLGTTNGAAFTTAYRRSTTTLTSYASSSNNNLFYAGTPGATNVIFYDGTNNDQTLPAFQTRVSTRDAASVTENPTFLSTTCSASNFLHIDPTIATQIESAGSPVAGVTDDFDGDIRNATSPDIGADEFSGILLDLSPPSITYTPFTSTLCLVDRTLTPTTISDASGVNIAPGTRPRMYFKKSTDANTFNDNTNATAGWKYVEATGAGGSPFDFTTNYALLNSPIANGDIIQYFVVAQDLQGTPLIGINSGSFAVVPASVALTAAAFPISGTINQYSILSGVPTTITIGASGQTYTSLTRAGGLFADLNTKGLTGNTVVTIVDASVAEDGANALNAVTYGCGGTYSLTIKPQTTSVLTGLLASGALIKLNGASNVIIDGSNSGGTDRSLTITNTSVTNPAAVWIGSTGAGTTDNTIKNCNISTGSNAATSYGIAISNATTIGNGGANNDNVTITNNNITQAYFGIFANGTASVSAGGLDNLIINNNIIGPVASGSTNIGFVGINVANAVNPSFILNTVQNLSATVSSAGGIITAATVNGASIDRNTIQNITSTTAAFYGMQINGLAGSSVNITRNTVSGVSGNTSSLGSSQVFGIQATVASTLDRNKIDNVVNNHTGTWGAIGLDVNGGNGQIIKNNFISNINQNISGGGAFSTTFGVIGLRLNTGTGHQVYHNSVNLYGPYTGSASSILSAAFALVSTSSTGCDVRNNIFSNTLTGGTTSIANVSIFLPSGGTSALNLTLNNNAYYTGTTAGVHGIAHGGTTYTSPVTVAGTGLYTAANFVSTATTPVTNLRNYTSSLLAANTNNDNASYAFISAAPFTSNIDLHIPNATSGQLESGGASVGVTNDIDNQVRPGPAGSVNGGGTAPDIGADEFDGTPASNMIYVSGTTTQTNITNVGVGTNDQHVIGIQIVTSGTLSPINATSFTINTNGTTNTADISNAKLWYTGTSSTFATTTQFGSTVGAPSGSFNVTGTQTLSTGTNYFWLTYDIPCTAVLNNVIDAECNSVTVVSPQTPTIQAPVGSRTIISGGLNGTVTIGAAGTYPTITGVGGLFAAINANGLSGNLTANILDASITETGVTVLNAVNYICTGSSYTVTIKPNAGVTTTLTGSATSGLITLNGADNVIMDGSNNGTASRDLTIVNTNTGTTSAVIWMQSNGVNGATNNTVKNCNIAGNGNTQTLFGIGMGSATIGTSSLGTGNNSNTIQNNNISKTQYGIYSQGASIASKNTGNIITQNLMNTTSPNHIAKGGIWLGFEDNIQVTRNNIDGVTLASSPDVFGIALGLTGLSTTSFTGNEVTNATVTENFIGKVTNTGTFSAAGITVASATSGTTLIANNSIYGVGANGTGGDYGAGIFLGGGVGSTTNVYYNSISMTGTFTGGSYPNFGLAIGGTDPTVNVRNNVFYNTLVNGTGTSYAIGTASSTFANLVSNYNDFFITTGAGFSIGKTGSLSQGSGTDQTLLSAWQTATAQDANTISGNPLFGTLTNLQPSPGSPLVAAGTPIAGITTDITGFTRNATTPTIGAYEQAGDFNGPTIVYTTLGNSSCLTDRTLTPVTITDNSGVNIAPGTRPRLYFKKSTDANTFNDNTNATPGWKYVEATGAAGSPFSFTTNYSLLNSSPVVAGNVIQYFVVAQDNATPNVSINSGTFTANPTSVALTAAAFPITGTINSYNLATSVSADVTIGSGGTYPTFTGTGGLFEAINSGGITANITARIISTPITEPGTVALNSISYGCSVSPYQLYIIPNTGVAAVLTGANPTGAIIKLNGADYVTIDGLNSGGSSLSITNTSPTTTSATIWIASANAGDGATNDSIRNCTIKGATNITTPVAILAGSGTTYGGAAEAANSNNSISGNVINTAQNAIFISGLATTFDQNWNISNNNMGSIIPAEKMSFRGMLISNAQNFNINSNNIFGVVSTASSSATMTGIQVSGAVNGGTISKNKISDIKQVNTAGWGSNGIFLAATSTTSNVNVFNNMIHDVASFGFNDVTAADNGYGIMVNSGGGYNIQFNSINMTTNQTDAGSITAAINIASGVTTAGSLDIRDNIFANNQTVGTRYAILCSAANTVFSSINYNDYFSAGTLGFLGSAQGTLALWQTATAQDANSLNIAPVFVSATDLHLVPASNCGLNGKGTPIAGISFDIDNDPRSATTPDMGADEFAAPGGGVITWTGAVNTDWNNAGNWGCGGIPTITSEVVIPTGVPNYPVITLNVEIKKLTVNTGASVTVATGFDLKLNGL